MGEYATHNGHSIKIGTCEDLYYLRADQARVVTPERGSLNPNDPAVQAVIRFRFPWPDEDHIAPGAFEAFERAVPIDGPDVSVPAEVEHHRVQFTAPAGYLLSIPCPERHATEDTGLSLTHTNGLRIARNGFRGRVRLIQQAYRNGHLAAICECGGCGARYNLPTLADAQPLIDACRARAARDTSPWWAAVADRIAAGYQARPEAEVA